MSTSKVGTAIGQQTPTQFVHRVYEESHVRFLLATHFENDKPVATVVHFRLETGAGLTDFELKSQVFGVGHGQFVLASEVFKAQVRDFINNGRMPA